MAKERARSTQTADIRSKATRPLDPSEAIARIPASDIGRAEADEASRIDGVIVASVVDNVDPSGAARVRTEFRHPALGADPVVAWCRTVAAGAGAGRGVAFLPHVGDEVIVGFAGGDTADPILFGGLWSAADPPPDGSGDDGTQAIVTRSGIRIEFDDDRGSVTVETGGGRRIVLGDDAGECTIEDPHGNSIRLDAEGITIASGGGLDVSATGAIRIDGAAVSSNAPTATFGGTVTADTVAATNIVGENYTPGAGNVW